MPGLTLFEGISEPPGGLSVLSGIGSLGATAEALDTGPLIFHAPLTHSLALTTGTGAPTSTRATTATVEDHEGILKTALSGEPRFMGARRVWNHVTGSESVTAWTEINCTVVALGGGLFEVTTTGANARFGPATNGGTVPVGRIAMCSAFVATAAADVQLRAFEGGTGANTSITADSSNVLKRYRVSRTVGAGASSMGCELFIPTSGTIVRFQFPQIEDTTGQSNQNPGEYVSVGVLSAPYHGANVDGVKYFNTLNGNTVASNVVTEAAGAAIAAATLKGYFAEGQRTNLQTQSNTFSNAVWNKIDGAISSAGTGPDGAVASLFTEAANAADHYMRSGAVTFATSTAYTISVYAKANGRRYIVINGIATNPDAKVWFDLTGGVVGTQTNATGTIAALGDGWYRCSATFTTGGAIDFNLWDLGISNANGVTNYTGDGVSGVYFYGAQVEAGAFPSSYIPTTSAAVTRNADVLSYPLAGNIVRTVGTAFAEVTAVGYAGNPRVLADSTDGAGPLVFSGAGQPRVYDGTTFADSGLATVAANVTVKHAAVWSGVAMKAFGDGVAGTSQVFDTDMLGVGTNLQIASTASSRWYGALKNVKIFDSALSDVEVAAL